MEICNNNLCIRNATPRDCGQLAAWWNDGAVMAHAGFPLCLGTTADKIKSEIADDSDDTRRRLTVGRREGTYDGMPLRRQFRIVLPDGTTRTVSYSGRPKTVKIG